MKSAGQTKKSLQVIFCMSQPFSVNSEAPSRLSMSGPSVGGGTPPPISQCESREAHHSSAVLMKSPSINDECQTQHAVWPAKQRRSWCKLKVTAGQETRCGMATKHCKGSREDVRRTPQQMSLCPFRLSSKCGGGHLRGGSSCHFLSHPLTFGILGCMPWTSTGSGTTMEGILLDKGTWGRDTERYMLNVPPPPFVFFSTKLQDYIKQDLVWCVGFFLFFSSFSDNWTDTVDDSVVLLRLEQVTGINAGWKRRRR